LGAGWCGVVWWLLGGVCGVVYGVFMVCGVWCDVSVQLGTEQNAACQKQQGFCL
jgi:hypothetical protein